VVKTNLELAARLGADCQKFDYDSGNDPYFFRLNLIDAGIAEYLNPDLSERIVFTVSDDISLMDGGEVAVIGRYE